MFAPEAVGFGTVAERAAGLDTLVEHQWRPVWSATRGFAFDLATLRHGGDDPVFWAAATWSSVGADAAGMILAERPDLFRALSPPRRIHGERLADHMSAMLAAERRRVRSLEAEMDAAVTAGRAGHGLTIRVRLAVLALMRSTDVIDTVTQELPALLGIALTSMVAARFGARLAHRLSPRLLKRLFAGLLFCVGLNFLL